MTEEANVDNTTAASTTSSHHGRSMSMPVLENPLIRIALPSLASLTSTSTSTSTSTCSHSRAESQQSQSTDTAESHSNPSLGKTIRSLQHRPRSLSLSLHSSSVSALNSSDLESKSQSAVHIKSAAAAQRQQLYSSLTRSIDSQRDRARVTALDPGLVLRDDKGNSAFVLRQIETRDSCKEEDVSSRQKVAAETLHRHRSIDSTAADAANLSRLLDSVILYVQSLVVTSPADNAGLAIGDLIVRMSDYSAQDWKPNRIMEVAKMVHEWPIKHGKRPLRIEVLRPIHDASISTHLHIEPSELNSSRSRSESDAALNARHKPSNESQDDHPAPLLKSSIRQVQALAFEVIIETWTAEDVHGKLGGGVLGAVLAPFPEPQPLPCSLLESSQSSDDEESDMKTVNDASEMGFIRVDHRKNSTKAKCRKKA